MQGAGTLTRRAALLGFAAAVAGCGAPARQPGNSFVAGQGAAGQADKIAALEREILALGPGVSPQEAATVARIAVEEPLVWARLWGAVDVPLIHNIQVNSGRKPRGLCKDWADDLEARLRQEGLATLDLHRAIANADTLLIEHSTVIVSPAGAAMTEGLVLDPWRLGQGRLWYGRVTEDPKYRWVPRAEVFAMKRRQKRRRALRDGV
ncbi:hypothetical protein [Maliponia aquimaris]|uniref:Lipoprotein n=1 Tax=Maliponia aquimaris TaxID=1673631 RepID=A0A238K1A7_9RHOB|nr:hypothetical protein [Maliponia aquimaris]SMX36227.1 hypothetical protein MAA8898_00794 [Maliponia aquimaris]